MRNLLFIILGYILAGVLAFAMSYNVYKVGYKQGYMDCIEEYQADMDTLRELHRELLMFYDKANE